jgi:hypothetical protein
MMSWLRRSILPIAIVVVTLPTLVFVLLGLPLLDTASRENWRVIQAGDSVDAAGYRWTLTQSQEFPGLGTDEGGNAVPVGLALVGAIVEVTPLDSPEEGSCETVLTTRIHGEEEVWDQVFDETDFNYELGEDRTPYCLLDGEALELELVFLTPEHVYDSATVDLSMLTDDGPVQFRFELAR